ncbi:MAG: hypothetical protein HEP71_06305 [Roseivirga sp.]|nr:hypothetical protein [Roseivirga sp.]
MLLRSFLSLLLVFGLANTASLSASTVQVHAGQQVEWYNNAHESEQVVGLPHFSRAAAIVISAVEIFNQVQTHKLSNKLCSIAIRQQNLLAPLVLDRSSLLALAPQYPSEDSSFSYLAS